MLNDEQKKASEYNKGPLLIVAGAGTGKTTVIVEKIKYLLKKKLAKPEEILALTFTEKAANEMEERVDKEIPYGYFQMWISTFHSFADQVLKENATEIGLSPSYRLMTEAETVIFLRKNIFLFNLKYFRPLGNPNKFLQSLLQHFSRLRDENIDPQEYVDFAKKTKTEDIIEKEKALELADAYKTYQALKLKENFFDYADLIFYLDKLFRTRKNILEIYQKKFKYVLVDEFQDTNIAQYDLIRLICPPSSNPLLTVVGDDSQAIYKFRGASVSNILNFMKDYQNAKQISLLKNYRSNQIILDIAYRLIKNNDPDTLEAKLGISKKLVADNNSNKSDKNAVAFNFSESAEDEADFVAKEITKLNKKFKYSDIAILTRANNHAQPFINALLRHGIPFQFLGPSTLYKQPEVKDLIAYLKVLNNPEDSVSLYRILNMDIFNIEIKDLTFLNTFAKKTNLPLFQAIETCLGLSEKNLYQEEFENYRRLIPYMKKETKEKLLIIYQMIKKHFAKVKKDTAGQILFYFLEDSKLLPHLANFKTEKDEEIALNISKFFNRLKAYESDHEDASINAVVDFIDMSVELGESPIASKTDIGQFNAVNIITAHSAKGLEFEVVFLANLTKGRFPTNERNEIIPIPDELIKEILPTGDYHIEEERRLFYVSITRAKEKLYMTASRFYGAGKREQKISPFVIESLGEENIKKTVTIKKEEQAQLSIFDFKKPTSPIIKQSYFPNTFSYTQLDTYIRCPLHYKYQYVLKIPTPVTSPLAFGDTIHRTLQNFYNEFLKDKNIDENRLLQIYKKNWLPAGYSSAAYEETRKKSGENTLLDYKNKFHKKNLNLIAIEKPFKIKITPDIYIVGKIDRVDNIGDDKIEIIDYKTGRMPKESDLKKSLQLSIYAMAAIDYGLYNKKLPQVLLTFFYLEEGKKISFQKSTEDLEETKSKIIEIVGKIRNNEFPVTTGPGLAFCSFPMICEACQ
ncbi:MAG: hypothetical protein US40_C0017G0004 [Candidatus Roizmanbacteria bacterium GW2011_GWC2_37_13]|uniref:DNA 3'-5' helicase n=1 Tax=Candidatus Roizmanbacteria bacterium GW2011_GWC2_37_13 TaxID=1618486 RepID=A0A0G0FZD8_9BACT|nr:MAG: hypothetical protein US38_C0016G0004 [Candidatus Roizmanbacteria bacterium GW2011_GWC1_37_12]KKQ24308.1 MAG: hypothetical protein US40_C0017G0004 [Candidatus Roizmanbacteria bacterium GW2011_GWC2_37_13]